jgi:hypothetical protein
MDVTLDGSDSLLFGSWRLRRCRRCCLYTFFQLLTFWPVCKESWARLDALALIAFENSVAYSVA